MDEEVSDMFWLKTCPRCKGDLFPDNDSWGQCIVCLQCGYRVYLSRQDGYQVSTKSVYALNTPLRNHSKRSKDRVTIKTGGA